ncbi:carboxypeptidase regulatory-like domain-containing protein [Candidatus Woesebacteria bacterium]|nr:MAG: carboxypeptidase regulatory-like domain-containing protein [Candidatus Woesebacteria bacterium]
MSVNNIKVQNKKLLIILILLVIIFGILASVVKPNFVNQAQDIRATWWDIQSIDTVKYSRDVAREKALDPTFDNVIDSHVRLIAETGATHVSIGTPYAQEFVPFLTRWVNAARKYNLKVWFRGNVPGWEGWFDYDTISREEHTALIKDFILTNGNLFMEGDIFSSCPECENGGPGDPRITRDVNEYRKFIIDEYRVTNDAFRKIGKNVRSNFVPMNGDVANLIMDKTTTQALGGIVVIDHYVGDDDRLVKDIESLALKSGGQVILGEFGAPISDLHGNLNTKEQAVWIDDALNKLTKIDDLVGINYWTSFGGSTKLWEDNFDKRPAVDVLTKYYQPKIAIGVVVNEIGQAVNNARIYSDNKSATTNADGKFYIPLLAEDTKIQVEADNYNTLYLNASGDTPLRIILIKQHENIFFKLRKVFVAFFTR